MNCKFCGAELVEGKPFCPSCGQNNAAEETPVEELAVEETVVEENVAAEEVAATEEAPESKTNKIAICIKEKYKM